MYEDEDIATQCTEWGSSVMIVRIVYCQEEIAQHRLRALLASTSMLSRLKFVLSGCGMPFLVLIAERFIPCANGAPSSGRTPLDTCSA